MATHDPSTGQQTTADVCTCMRGSLVAIVIGGDE